MVRLVEVIKNSGGTKTTTYLGDDGNTYVLTGDLRVRANNPGNISPSEGNRQFWIDNYGAIDFVPSNPGEPWVAVFPDLASGRAAQRYLWSTDRFQDLTIAQAAARWATDAYPDVLAQAAGVPSDTLVRDLSPAQMDAMFAAQAEAEGSSRLVVKDEAGNRLDPAIITGAHPVPPGLIPNSPTDILQNLKDRVAESQGYGNIAPTPRERPNYFNETGEPPVPVVRGTGLDVLSDLRDRVAGIAGQSVTPRLLTTSDGTPQGLVDPRPELDWGQFKEGVDVGGLGSLLDGGINPAAPNPLAPLPAKTLADRPLVQPTAAQLAAIRDVSMLDMPPLPRPRPQTPVQAPPVPLPRDARPSAVSRSIDARPPNPSLRAPASPLSGPSAGRPGGATEVPTGGGIDNGQSLSGTVAPVAREPQYVTVNGKRAQLGQSFVQGNRLLMVDVDASGRGVLRDVSDYMPAGANLLFENSVAGNIARGIAAPMIRDQIGQAGQAAQDALGNLFSNAVSTVGGAAMQARDLIGGMLSRPVAPVSANANLSSARSEQSAQRPPVTRAPVTAPVSANSNLSQARSEQLSQRSSVIAPRSVQLSAPTAGLSAAERAAIAAYSPPAPRTTTITTTVPNPAYAEWERRYGDGSQLQTAPTGGLVTRDQLAAIQGINGAVQAPIRPVAPPPPPRTITTRRVVPVQVTAPMVPTSPSLLRTKSEPAPAGAQTKIDQLRATGMSSAEAYNALTGGAGSVAEMERWHGSGESSGGPAGGYAMGGR